MSVWDWFPRTCHPGGCILNGGGPPIPGEPPHLRPCGPKGPGLGPGSPSVCALKWCRNGIPTPAANPQVRRPHGCDQRDPTFSERFGVLYSRSWSSSEDVTRQPSTARCRVHRQGRPAHPLSPPGVKIGTLKKVVVGGNHAVSEFLRGRTHPRVAIPVRTFLCAGGLAEHRCRNGKPDAVQVGPDQRHQRRKGSPDHRAKQHGCSYTSRPRISSGFPRRETVVSPCGPESDRSLRRPRQRAWW